jgi:hypothetical protein
VLGLEGERVVRLRSLDEADAEKLFLRAARAAEPEFSPTAEEMSLIKAICARLDGIALAIEMAAARAPSLGVALLLQRLDDRFRTLSGGRRTALPRHRTLQATLDWSHSLLRPEEAAVFRRLSVFVGGFTVSAAREVVSDAQIDPLAVEAILEGLCAKSLVVRERRNSFVRYKLLETTRIYAQQRLADTGEAHSFARRQAIYCEKLSREARSAYYVGEGRDAVYLELYGRDIGNVERAIEWAFGPDGDREIGLSLLAHAIVIFYFSGEEVRLLRWIEQEGLSSDGVPDALRQGMLVSRVMGLINTTQITPEIADEMLRAVPVGSDRLLRAVALLQASIVLSFTGQGEAIEANRREVLSLGFQPTSRLVLWMTLPELMLMDAAPHPDRPAIRSRSNHLREQARLRGFEEFELVAMFYGWSREFCWVEGRDAMIEHVKRAITQHLMRDDVVTLVTLTRWVGSRLIMAQCGRGRTEDVAGSKALAQDIAKRLGVGASLVDWSGCISIALAEGRVKDAAQGLGYARAMTDAWNSSNNPYFLKVQRLVRAAMSADALESALVEGAKLSRLEAYDLLMGLKPAAGGAHG